MKNRFKVFSLSIMAGVIASFVSTGSVLAEPKPARVEPIEKCYHFNAEKDACGHDSSTWLIEYIDPEDTCAVRVFAAYGSEWDCKSVKKKEHVRQAEKLGRYTIYDTESNKGEKITDFLVDNTECSEIWLRSVDKDGCNKRCFIIRGSWVCL